MVPSCPLLSFHPHETLSVLTPCLIFVSSASAPDFLPCDGGREVGEGWIQTSPEEFSGILNITPTPQPLRRGHLVPHSALTGTPPHLRGTSKNSKVLISVGFLFFLSFFFEPHRMCCGILVPWPGIEPTPWT